MYGEIIETGHHFVLLTPSPIPRKPWGRVKTARRDALSMARLRRVEERTRRFDIEHYDRTER